MREVEVRGVMVLRDDSIVLLQELEFGKTKNALKDFCAVSFWMDYLLNLYIIRIAQLPPLPLPPRLVNYSR